MDTVFSNQNKHIKKRKVLLFSALALFMLVAYVDAIIVQNHKQSINIAEAVKSTCASTLYPELCMSSIAASPAASGNIRNSIDVVMATLNYTITSVQHNYFSIQKINSTRKLLTLRQMRAIHDCLELTDLTLDNLHETVLELKGFGTKNYSLSKHIDTIKILLSAAEANQLTCLDGFSHNDADREVRSDLIDGEMHVFRLCSNVLAIVSNLTGSPMSYEHSQISWGLEAEDGTAWPKWLSAGDRRLLQAATVIPNVTVAADGTGDYQTVEAAVEAAPLRSSERYVIKIKAGVYRENVVVPSNKHNLMFIGDGRTSTIITGYRSVGGTNHSTFNSATVAVNGRGFLARDITFENTAGPSNDQAVALRVSADFSAIYKCDMLAFQDTLYVHNFRQFYVDCIVIGTVDFIFGFGAAVLQDCDIHARRPNPGQRNMVTADGRSDPNANTGIVIQNCRVGATSDLEEVKDSFATYLGRPWQMYSRTVIMQSSISDIIHPAGWFPWNADENTLFYAEYENTGPGADTTNRVTWEGYRVLTSENEALPFAVENFISGDEWLPDTGFPFSRGL